jgi:hypothetical protein
MAAPIRIEIDAKNTAEYQRVCQALEVAIVALKACIWDDDTGMLAREAVAEIERLTGQPERSLQSGRSHYLAEPQASTAP